MWNLVTILCLIQFTSFSNGQREACIDFCRNNNPDDRFTVGNKKMILIHKEETWHNAKEKCEKLGMRLLTLSTSEENRLMGNYLTGRVQGEVPSLAVRHWNLWIAASDEKVKGTFVWATTGENLSFSNWARGEPNFGSRRDSCVEISFATRDGTFWNDSTCKGLRRYICEMQDYGLE